MHAIETPSRPARCAAPPPRLCGTVEGVEFWIPLPNGRRLRCVITEAALQGHYGAEADRPESWLFAFARHRPDIEDRVLAAAARREDVHVVLVTDSDGRLKASVGPCGP
jgi:hypothetical protein